MKRIVSWIKHEHRIIYIEYFVPALAIMLPLLLPGFILTLDMVFVPHLAFPAELSNTWPLEALLWLLGLILPADVVQKLVLFAILVLSGAGMHRLARTAAAHKLIDSAYLKWGAYFAGILYMINPFTYSRFMAGQWMVLLGYALLPFLVLALIRLAAKPGFKTALIAAVWATLISIASVHHTGMVAIFVAALLGLAIWKYRGSARLKSTGSWILGSVGIMLVLNSFWLLPAATGQTDLTASIRSFDATHHQAFATDDSGPFGAAGNVLRLQGFWLESREMYVLPQERMPIWGLVSTALWMLVGIGAVTAWRTQRFTTLLVAIAGGIGAVLAAIPLIMWASEAIPVLGGYREPQKFVNLLALAYAYFGALGAVHLMGWARARWHETGVSGALVVTLLIPLVLTPVMFWGFGHQLQPRQYPDDWHTVNAYLNERTEGNAALFLPWSQYMHFDFAGRIIANPAEKFFDQPVIASDDPEFEDISPTNPDPVKRELERALNNTDQLLHALADHNIRFIILAKTHTFEEYGYLDELSGMAVVHDSKTLTVYELEGE